MHRELSVGYVYSDAHYLTLMLTLCLTRVNQHEAEEQFVCPELPALKDFQLASFVNSCVPTLGCIPDSLKSERLNGYRRDCLLCLESPSVCSQM